MSPGEVSGQPSVVAAKQALTNSPPAAPESLRAAQASAPPAADVKSTAAQVAGTGDADQLNATAVGVLNALADQSIKLTPTPLISSINTAITLCVASLSS